MLKLECGLDLERTSQSVMRTIHLCQVGAKLATGPLPDWDTMEQHWGMYARLVKRGVILCSGDDVSAKLLAKNLYETSFVPDDPPIPYDQLTRPHQLVWEAVGRHIATLVDFDEENMDDLEATEKRAGEWVKHKLGV